MTMPGRKGGGAWTAVWTALMALGLLSLILPTILQDIFGRNSRNEMLMAMYLGTTAYRLLVWIVLAVQCCRWCAREPGGLKGWRIGLLFSPFTTFVWVPVEVFRAAYHFRRGESKRAGRLILMAVALVLSYVFQFGFLAWGIIAILLDRSARRQEVVPTSSRKRLIQLAAVLGVQYGLFILLLAGGHWWVLNILFLLLNGPWWFQGLFYLLYA